jgi:hypothetical protein
MLSTMRCAFLVVLVTLSACGEGTVDCVSPFVQVAAHDAQVTAITLQGPGCEGAEVLPDALSCPGGGLDAGAGFVPGCAYYYVRAHAAGACTIRVELLDGRALERLVNFSRGTQECPGYYPLGSSSWVVADSFADSGLDAAM